MSKIPLPLDKSTQEDMGKEIVTIEETSKASNFATAHNSGEEKVGLTKKANHLSLANPPAPVNTSARLVIVVGNMDGVVITSEQQSIPMQVEDPINFDSISPPRTLDNS
jgi:hypothetical protein